MNNTTKPITIMRPKKLQKIMRIIIINAILEICTKFKHGGLSTPRRGHP